MIDPRNPAWWAAVGATVASLLGAFGVGSASEEVRAVFAAAGPLAAAIYALAHHLERAAMHRMVTAVSQAQHSAAMAGANPGAPR